MEGAGEGEGGSGLARAPARDGGPARLQGVEVRPEPLDGGREDGGRGAAASVAIMRLKSTPSATDMRYYSDVTRANHPQVGTLYTYMLYSMFRLTKKKTPKLRTIG